MDGQILAAGLSSTEVATPSPPISTHRNSGPSFEGSTGLAMDPARPSTTPAAPLVDKEHAVTTGQRLSQTGRIDPTKDQHYTRPNKASDDVFDKVTCKGRKRGPENREPVEHVEKNTELREAGVTRPATGSCESPCAAQVSFGFTLLNGGCGAILLQTESAGLLAATKEGVRSIKNLLSLSGSRVQEYLRDELRLLEEFDCCEPTEDGPLRAFRCLICMLQFREVEQLISVAALTWMATQLRCTVGVYKADGQSIWCQAQGLEELQIVLHGEFPLTQSSHCELWTNRPEISPLLEGQHGLVRVPVQERLEFRTTYLQDLASRGEPELQQSSLLGTVYEEGDVIVRKLQEESRVYERTGKEILVLMDRIKKNLGGSQEGYGFQALTSDRLPETSGGRREGWSNTPVEAGMSEAEVWDHLRGIRCGMRLGFEGRTVGSELYTSVPDLIEETSSDESISTSEVESLYDSQESFWDTDDSLRDRMRLAVYADQRQAVARGDRGKVFRHGDQITVEIYDAQGALRTLGRQELGPDHYHGYGNRISLVLPSAIDYSGAKLPATGGRWDDATGTAVEEMVTAELSSLLTGYRIRLLRTAPVGLGLSGGGAHSTGAVTEVIVCGEVYLSEMTIADALDAYDGAENNEVEVAFETGSIRRTGNMPISLTDKADWVKVRITLCCLDEQEAEWMRASEGQMLEVWVYEGNELSDAESSYSQDSHEEEARGSQGTTAIGVMVNSTELPTGSTLGSTGTGDGSPPTFANVGSLDADSDGKWRQRVPGDGGMDAPDGRLRDAEISSSDLHGDSSVDTAVSSLTMIKIGDGTLDDLPLVPPEGVGVDDSGDYETTMSGRPSLAYNHTPALTEGALKDDTDIAHLPRFL
jgi:hypothetical protein